MNLRENLEKLECAKLQAEKEKLTRELEFLKESNVNSLLVEGMGGPMAMQQTPPMQGMQQSATPTQIKKSKRPMQQTVPQEQQLMPGQDPRTGFSLQAQYGIPDPQMKVIKQEGVAALQKAQQGQNPLTQKYEYAMPQQGFALTPKWAEAQNYYMQNWYDNPDVPGIQKADKPSWQNLQTALSNYFGSQVNELMRKQRMMG